MVSETIRDLCESSFSVNADVDRAFNQAGVYPPKMVNTGGSKYEGEIDKGWKLTYDEKSGDIEHTIRSQCDDGDQGTASRIHSSHQGCDHGSGR